MKKLTIFAVLAAFLMVAVSASAGVQLNRKNIWTAEQVFKYGISVNGEILLNGSPINQPWSKVWYVCSVGGQDTMGNDYGKSYSKPFATIEYAITQSRAGYGDVIVVMPSHNEAVSTAAALDFDKDSLFVIGFGKGDDKPTIDFDAQAGSVTVGADNVTIHNIRFRVSANATTVGLNLEDGSDYTHITDCEFGWAETATDEFAIALQIGDGDDYTVIENCQFHAGAQAAVTAIKITNGTTGSVGTVIRNNWITGNYSTAPILGATTAATNNLIVGNVFFTGGTADTFNLVAASTGVVAYNLITMNATSAAAAMDIGNCLNFENYIIADDDVGGTKGAIVSTTAASVTASADD